MPFFEKLGKKIASSLPAKFDILEANYTKISDLPEESGMRNLGIVAANGYLFVNERMNINMEEYNLAEKEGMMVELEDHIYINSTAINLKGDLLNFSDIVPDRIFPVKELFGRDIANIKFGEEVNG